MTLTADQRRRLLEQTVRELNRAIKEHGYMVEGSSGQPVVNPAVIERRQHLDALLRLDRSVPPVPAADPFEEFTRQ